MADLDAKDSSLPLRACQIITCIVPDDGTDRTLIRSLHEEKGITRVNSVSCRGIAALREARTSKGLLPQSTLVRMVTVVVSVTESDGLFDYIYEKARINQPRGGMIFLSKPIFSTTYSLPEDIMKENK